MDLLDHGKRGSGIAVSRRVGQLCKQGTRSRTEKAFRLFLRDVSAVARAVFEHIEGVTHTALRKSGDQLQRAVIGGEALPFAYGTQTADDGVHRYAVKIESLTARKDGRGDLMQFRGRKAEKNVLGRLLERFQKRVERRDRKHMDLVDDIHAELQLCRRVNNAVTKLTNAVNAVITCSVHFHNVRCGARVDRETSRAFSAGISVYGRKAVRRLCDDLRAGRLTRASRTAEQIRVGKLSVLNLTL